MAFIKSNQKENLLREPVEIWNTYAFGLAAFICFFAPEFLMFPPPLSISGTAIFLFIAVKNYLKYRKLKKYQSQLINLPAFIQSGDDINFSHKKLYLGKGFLWDERHAQRLFDLEKAIGRKFRELSLSYQLVRSLEVRFEHNNLLKPLIKFTQSYHKLNPFKPIPPVGGNPSIHAVGMYEGERNIYLDNANRNGHTIVLGTTRVGKTRLLETLVGQDIRRGDVVIVVDPKGDADLVQRMYIEAKKADRLDDFYIFHLGHPEISDAYNPISSFMRVTEVASRVAGQMPNEGQSSTFREFVWGYVNTLANALVTMGKKPDFNILKDHSESIAPLFVEYMEWFFKQHFSKEKYDEIMAEYDQNAIDDHISKDPQTHYAEFQKALHILPMSAPERKELMPFEKEWYDSIHIPKDVKERSVEAQAYYLLYKKYELSDNVGNQLCVRLNYSDAHLNKLIASLQPFLDKMTTGSISEIISPPSDSKKRTFSWREIIQRGGVVYVGLDALSDPEVAAAVGNSMFADLTSLAGQIYKTGHGSGLPTGQGFSKKKLDVERTIQIHADEFNEIIGDEFIPMLNKAGGAGIRVTAYTQTLADIEARLGNLAKAQQVLGNFNTQIMMRVQGKVSAELITERLKEVNVVTTDVISGSTDTPNPNSGTTFSSNTTQRQTSQKIQIISPHDIMALPKGQAFVIQDGNKIFKIRSPLPDSSDFKGIPSELEEMVKQMKKSYNSQQSTTIKRNWMPLDAENIETAKDYADKLVRFEKNDSAIGATLSSSINNDDALEAGLY